METVGGADVAYRPAAGELWAAVAVLSFPGLALLESAAVRSAEAFPYRPGWLGFREGPAILRALARLRRWPDVLLVEGHGRAHPRRFGSACHVGVIGEVATVGVAKTLLVGRHRPPAEERGAREPLLDGAEVVGYAVRTRSGVRPVYVSVGHRVELEAAVELVLRCSPRYRLPEPLRQAHRIAREAAARAGGL
ncbi:MAG: endonuclease V [Deferrisomatales bacterium]